MKVLTESHINKFLKLGLKAYMSAKAQNQEELAHEILKRTSNIADHWLNMSGVRAYYASLNASKVNLKAYKDENGIDRCPECSTPLTITKWGLNEEAVCGGCGYTEN